MRVAILVLLLLPDVAYACRFCGSYTNCRYYAPAVVKSTPVNNTSYDQRFQVTYNLSLPAPAQAGSTLFQYSQQAFPYVQPELYFNAAARYQEQAAANAAEGYRNFTQAASLVFAQQAEIANTHAKTAFVEAVAKATAPLPVGGSLNFSLTATRGADGRIQIQQNGAAPSAQVELNPAAIVKAKCVRCHQRGAEAAYFDLTDLSKLTPDMGRAILDRITTSDPRARMPKGGSLSPAEIYVMHEAYFAAAAEEAKAKGEGPPKEAPMQR
jgi:hypothetical protein